MNMDKPTVERRDTGAPRGERNMWYVAVNGHIVFQQYGSRCPQSVENLYVNLRHALGITE
jgi:hypothetical protein